MTAERAISLLLLTLAQLAGAARAQISFVLIDTDLTVRAVEVVRFDTDALIFVGAEGERESIPTNEVHLLTTFGHAEQQEIPDALDDAAPPMVLETTGGQRLLVRAEPSHSDDEFTVVADRVGAVSIVLDRIARLYRGAPPTDQPRRTGVDDTIQLVNGDTLNGFIEAVGPSVVIDLDRGPDTLALDRIASMTLANRPALAPGTLVALRGGTIIAVDSIRSTGVGTVELVLPSGDAALSTSGEPPRVLRVPLNDIRGVRYRNHPLRGHALADLPAPEVVASPNRRWSPPPTVQQEWFPLPGLRSVDLGGPVRLLYDLPAGASRFGAYARLAPGPFADCELVVGFARTDGSKAELARHRLRSGMGSTQLSVALPPDARRLVIEVEPGPSGPIQDRVILNFPIILSAEESD